MGLQMHARRAMQRVVGAARTVAATHAVRGIDAARPIYEAGRPVLHHFGVDTKLADRALSGYDGIRRALGK